LSDHQLDLSFDI